MSVPIPEVHPVTLKRPAQTRDAGNNMGTLNYASPTLTKTVLGLVQRRAGTLDDLNTGRTFGYDAMFYTRDSDVQPNDLLQPSGIAGVGDLIVQTTEQKCGLDGVYSHTQCTCTLKGK